MPAYISEVTKALSKLMFFDKQQHYINSLNRVTTVFNVSNLDLPPNNQYLGKIGNMYVC